MMKDAMGRIISVRPLASVMTSLKRTRIIHNRCNAVRCAVDKRPF